MSEISVQDGSPLQYQCVGCATFWEEYCMTSADADAGADGMKMRCHKTRQAEQHSSQASISISTEYNWIESSPSRTNARTSLLFSALNNFRIGIRGITVHTCISYVRYAQTISASKLLAAASLITTRTYNYQSYLSQVARSCDTIASKSCPLRHLSEISRSEGHRDSQTSSWANLISCNV